MTWIWLVPVPILLVGFSVAALLARAASRELARVGDEQAKWAAVGAALARIRVRTDELAGRRQELGRR